MAEGQQFPFPTLDQLSQEAYEALLQELMASRQGQAHAHAPPVAPEAAPIQLPKPPKPDPFRGGRKVASWLFTVKQYFTATGVANGAAKVAYKLLVSLSKQLVCTPRGTMKKSALFGTTPAELTTPSFVLDEIL